MTSTAEPLRASSISAWRMRAAAPASTPQVGWLTTITRRAAVELAADDEFLQVAARKRRGFGIARALAHVHLLDDALRGRVDGAGP